MAELSIVGRAEKIDFLDLNIKKVPAKIDTGADLGAIWVSKAEMKEDGLHCIFFGSESPYFTGETFIFKKDQIEITRIANSFGHKEIRYQVKLRLRIKGRIIRGSFTLANRSSKLYPILIGRRFLKGKFLVDVSKGSPLRSEEKKRKQNLKKELKIVEKGDIT